ncbi:MAG: NAD(P)/FAD-dependent oxidoreductase, partial [Lentisphaeria bacterium]
LILATGAHCFLPPIKGIELKGIIALRNKENLDELLLRITEAKQNKKVAKVVVIGGGVLGLETADSLTKLGCEVTVLEACPTILPRQMDADGQKLLINAINSSDVKVHTGVFVDEIYGHSNVEGVLTSNHTKYPCDIVVVSAGIRSNLKLAQDAELETVRGIVVDEYLQTADKSIYAIGDCAEINGQVAGLWDAALEQGAAAGANVVGDSKAYCGKALGVTFHAFGAKMFSIGDLGFNKELNYETVMVKDDLNKVYRKIYFSNGTLVGGVLFGDVRLTNALHTAINKKFSIEEAKDNKLI